MKETRVQLLSFHMLFSALALMGVGLASPRLVEAFSMDLSQAAGAAGMIVSAQCVGGVVGCVLSGVYSKRFGSSLITRVSLAFLIGALLLFGYALNFPMALLGVFLLGVGVAGVQNSAMASGLSLEGRSDVINAVLQTSFSVGAIILPALFYLFLRFSVWRHLYLLLAVVALLAVFAARGKKETGEKESTLKILAGYGKYMTKPVFLLGPVAVFLYQGAEISIWSLGPTLFESIGGGVESGIVSNALLWAMILLGRLFSMFLMRKANAMKLLMPFGLLGIFALAGLMVTKGVAAIICTSLAGLAFAPFFAFLTTWATEITGDHSSAYLAFIMVAGSFGPIVLGLIVSAFSKTLTGGLMVLPALCAFMLMMVLLVIFNRHGKEQYHENDTTYE